MAGLHLKIQQQSFMELLEGDTKQSANLSCHLITGAKVPVMVSIVWTIYNLQLIELMKRIPKESPERTCMVDGKSLTLNFLIVDYVQHLEHHL